MPKDWIGLWFEIQAERGHGDDAPFFLAHLDSPKFENFCFRHREKDGVAAKSEVLCQLRLQRRQAGRKVSRPPWFTVPRLLWRGLVGNGDGRQPNWRSLRPEITRKPSTFTFLVLREPQERALAKYLQMHRISLTAYLLSKLSKTLEPSLLTGPITGAWQIPVNMRPAFPGRGPGGNCVSYVKVTAGESATEIHREIKHALTTFEHWSNWWILHIGKVVGLRGMRKLSRRASERSFWIGSFTDLGDWTPLPSVDSEKYQHRIWAIAPPGTPNNPVGCATIAWCGQRSISLRIHPSLSEDPQLAGEILRQLAHAIALDTGASAASLLQTEI